MQIAVADAKRVAAIRQGNLNDIVGAGICFT